MTETTFDLESYFLMRKNEKKGSNFLGSQGRILMICPPPGS